VFSSSATADWTAGANLPETRYELRASSIASFDHIDDKTAAILGLTGSVTGLTPDTSYYFGVRAVNHAAWPRRGNCSGKITRRCRRPYRRIRWPTRLMDIRCACRGKTAAIRRRYLSHRAIQRNFAGGLSQATYDLIKTSMTVDSLS